MRIFLFPILLSGATPGIPEGFIFGVLTLMGIIVALPIIFYIICGWRIFTKAGKPGWAIFIPVYNSYVLLRVVKKPLWWLVWFILPLVFVYYYVTNHFDISVFTYFWYLQLLCAVFFVLTLHGLSLAFGKDAWFTLGLFLLPFIFIPILAFGASVYIYGPPAEQFPGDHFSSIQ